VFQKEREGLDFKVMGCDKTDHPDYTIFPHTILLLIELYITYIP